MTEGKTAVRRDPKIQEGDSVQEIFGARRRGTVLRVWRDGSLLIDFGIDRHAEYPPGGGPIHSEIGVLEPWEVCHA